MSTSKGAGLVYFCNPNNPTATAHAHDVAADFLRTVSADTTILVDVKKPIHEFAAACKQNGVRVGRPFLPLETHARISLGTMDEMERATKVFAKVLGVSASKAA